MRTYDNGRPTKGWKRGKRITASEQVKPGDVLIALSHQFRAENLVRVLPVPPGFMDIPGRQGFYYEYVDCKTLQHSDGQSMYCHGWELAGPQHEYFRAIDRRACTRRIPASKLPAWLVYA